MLVEIILGKETGDKALATALDYVRAIRKTPIVVNDSRGFYANRCVLNYHAGRPPDAARRRAAGDDRERRAHGRHAGRAAVAHRRGGARSRPARSCKATEADLGAEAVNPAQKKLLEEMVEKHGRFGRKNGKGFYDYPQGQPKRLWPGLADLQPKKLTRDESRRSTSRN